MFYRIKNKIDKQLTKFVLNIDKTYSLNKISPLLSKSIKDFILRKGKRIRPVLFVMGYMGFSRKIAAGLYSSAISMELLHDFMLIHDDIIDKSDTRRNKPSMHKMLNNYLSNYKNIKFNGLDLAIVVGDIVYAMAIDTFLSIREKSEYKEKALQNFIRTAMLTASGEFIELLCGIKDIKKITQQDIYKIYDYKTARYSFASPLSIGAMLGGAKQRQIEKLFRFGIYLGRAFQLKDDILGMFGDEDEIGKSAISDLQEAKKTMLIWYAYRHSNKSNKLLIKKILSKRRVNVSNLLGMRKLIEESNALDYAKKEISRNISKAKYILMRSAMHPKYKNALSLYLNKILSL